MLPSKELAAAAYTDLLRARSQADAKDLENSDEFRAFRYVAWHIKKELDGKTVAVLCKLDGKSTGDAIEKLMYELVTKKLPGLKDNRSGPAGTDLAPLRLDFKSSRSKVPQFTSKKLCDCEVIFGASEHLLVVHYKVVKGRLYVTSVKFVPAWLHNDKATALVAESLRRRVACGELSAWEAAKELRDKSTVRRVCDRMLSRLGSRSPIPAGPSTVVPVADAFRSRLYEVEEAEPGTASGSASGKLAVVGPVPYPDDAAIEAMYGQLAARKGKARRK